MNRDPVCGMECDPNTSLKMEYKGQSYCFCSEDCKSTFEKDPERYIHAQPGAQRGLGYGGHR